MQMVDNDIRKSVFLVKQIRRINVMFRENKPISELPIIKLPRAKARGI
jgi:hypothetical protein